MTNNANTRPNYIVFITDQHRADWLGCYGHPVVKTPNIDAMAETGTRFGKFHVASPVCMPNRASLMTGRYPSVHGLRSNGCLLPQSATTFVDVLAQDGYRTASIGKSHLQPFLETEAPGRNREDYGPIEEAWREPEGDYSQEQPIHYDQDGRYAFKTPYYGFQHVDMVINHGDRCDGHYRQWFREQTPDWQDLVDDKNELPHDYTCPQAYRTPIPEDLYPTTYIRDRAVDYVSEAASDTAPFFLFVSFPDPHHPFNPPGKYWDMYAPDEFSVDLPISAHHNPTPPMQFLKDQWKNSTQASSVSTTAFMVGDKEIKEAMALTAGMITMVDDAIGAIVAALKASGLYDDTVLCFTSDHGDFLGDFNMMLKGAMPFKAVTNVPFIWSDPEDRTARTSEVLSSTIDIAATILARSGITPYRGMQGKSLLRSMDGSEDVRDDLLIEYNDGLPRLGFDTSARVRALLTDRFRLTVYKGETWGELYDLQNDPHECNNRWDAPEYQSTKSDLMTRLCHQLIAQMDESPGARYLA